MAERKLPSSPWARFISSSLLSDLTVLLETPNNNVGAKSPLNDLPNSTAPNTDSVDGEKPTAKNTFILHRFPLFTRSEYFKRKCEEASDRCHVTIFLTSEMVPCGSRTFHTIAEYCYGLPPKLTAETVVDVLVAAENLGMTEDYSQNNLMELCQTFVKEQVYSNWKDCLSLLENVKDSTLNCEVIADILKGCETVILDHAAELDSDESKSAVIPVKSFFKKLSSLAPFVLRKVLQGFLNKNLTFVFVGNYLAEKNYSMVLHENSLTTFENSEKDEQISSDSAVNEAVSTDFKQANQRAILDCLIESLGFSASGFKADICRFRNSYIVTLLKYSCKLKSKYEIVLQDFLSLKVESCSLKDLEALELETVISLLSESLSSKEISNGSADCSSGEKSMSYIANLVDNFLLFSVSHSEDFQLCHIQALVEIVPDSFREKCDTLYNAIDLFLEKNPTVDLEDRQGLCDYLDPFKLSEEKTQIAIQNNRIPLQPGFFTTLYLAQNIEVKNQQKLILNLQEEMENLRADLQHKDVVIAKLLTQADSAMKDKARSTVISLQMEALLKTSCRSSVSSIAIGQDGMIWIGGSTLSCWRGVECLWVSSSNKYTEFETLSCREGILWAGCFNGMILLVKDFKEVADVEGHKTCVTSLCTKAKSNSKYLCYSSSADRRIKLWEWTGRSISCLWTTTGSWNHRGSVLSLSEDANGKLWSSGEDGMIKCWENAMCLKTVVANSGPVRALAVGSHVFSGGNDGVIKCWTLSGVLMKELRGHKDWIQCLVIDKNGVLWSGSDDRVIRAWKGPWEAGRCVCVSEAQEDLVGTLAVDAENNLYSGGGENTVTMWKAVEET